MGSRSNLQRISRGKRSQDFRFLSNKEWLKPLINKNVLDLGCGNGVYTKYLIDLGIKPIALDVDHGSLRSARKYVGQPKLKICQASGVNLPFDDAVFDLVICIETLSHIPHEKHSIAFKEINRVIKKDGTLITSVHNSARFALQNIVRLKKPESAYKNPGLTIYPFTKKELSQNLTQVGFSLKGSISFINFYNSIHQRYPKFFPILVFIETCLSHIPLLNRISLTILAKAVKSNKTFPEHYCGKENLLN